jgi:3-oxoacyl-[acyl-carrier-protein] synthase II
VSVVLTGVGTIGPWGTSTDELAAAWRAGELRLTEVARDEGFHHRSSARFAGLVDHSSYRDKLPGPAARRMCVNSRMAVAASRMAVESAGLLETDLAGPETAVAFGTTFASSEFTMRLMRQMHEGGPQSASPFLFMETVANAYAGQTALHFDARGSNASVTQREASGAMAVARALHMFASGNCRRVLAGAVDEVSTVVHGALDSFRALARPDADGRERARVFDANRGGCIASEGATIFVLETEDDARARGARIHGRIRGAIRAHDPSASSYGWGDGAAVLAGELEAGLARHGLTARDFDRIVSGASGSRAGDRLEGQVLRRVFGESGLPPVLAPKAVTGEFGGGLLAAAALALTDDRVGSTPDFETFDPEVGIRPHDGSSLPLPDRVLVSSLASGGTACWLILERC